MDDTPPDTFSIGFIIGVFLAVIIGHFILPEGELVGIKINKNDNTKYIEYNNSIYMIVPYKTNIKE